MGAALHSGFAACLAPMNSLTDSNDRLADKPISTDEDPVVLDTVHSDKVNKVVKPERKHEEDVRVQAAEDIHYGSAGIVLKGATGIVLGKFEGNGSPFIFVNWDAFPELGRVSVQPEKLLPMHDDRRGTYVVTREAGVTQTAALAKECVGILQAGTTINIVEVVHVPEAMRWRGRLEEPVKGWISILASNNGARWAEHLSAGGAGKPQPVPNGAPPQQLATSSSFQVAATQHGTQLPAMQPMGCTRGRSPARAGVSSHTVVSSERSLSAQRAAAVVYGNYSTGRVYSSSRPHSLAPSQSGSFHYPVQAQERTGSFHYPVNGDTCSAASSLRGSVQFPISGPGQASGGVQYARVMQRPASFAVGEQQLGATRVMSMDEVSLRVASASQRPPSARSLDAGAQVVRNVSGVSGPSSQQENKKTSPEVLAVLQGIKQQLKGMADRYTDKDDTIQGSDANGNIPRADVPEQAAVNASC